MTWQIIAWKKLILYLIMMIKGIIMYILRLNYFKFKWNHGFQNLRESLTHENPFLIPVLIASLIWSSLPYPKAHLS